MAVCSSDNQLFLCTVLAVQIKLSNSFHPPLLFWSFNTSVDKLREHWEQAYARVNQRKNQLDDMLLECRQFDEMYAEFNRWISQIEDELDTGKIDPKAEDIDKQIAKQKVLRKYI